jgi:uncharacterized RDD family membrane protein YckC
MIIEEKYNTGFKRLAAIIADGLLLLLPVFIVMQVKNAEIFSWVRTIYLLVPVSYFVFCHYRYGATLGKQLMDIKVVDINTESKISLWQAILRDSFWILSSLLLFTLTVTANVYDLNINYGWSVWLSNFDNLWALLELTTMLTNRKRRALHDYIAKTVVIKTIEQTTTNIHNEAVQ